MPHELPPPILISPEGSFAWDVFHRRHPVLIESLLAALPYGPEQVRALRALLDESLDGVITPLADDAPDAAQWHGPWDRGHYGKPWADTPFLWAESYFFRRILAATGYYGGSGSGSGWGSAEPAWAGVDPYQPMKDAELADPALEAAFAWYGALEGAEPERRFAALVEAAVLGNRADLVFQVTETVEGYAAVNPPLADDTGGIRSRLLAARGGTQVAGPRVAVICDNSGRELLADLLLADELLGPASLAAVVELHVKPAPYYISDATATDFGKALRRLRGMPAALGAAGQRLFAHAAAGRLRAQTHPFWCSPLSFHDLPADLRAGLDGRFLLVKGDLNYRRLVGDRWWDPTTPFADTVRHLGLPVAALRAAKSDVVVGLSRGQVERLDKTEPDWRLNGRHSLVQTA
ncbi:protein-glutamate O-methyltransferase family protein [Actinocrinis puniceicyclus]|uniref:Protein-glutamate O-methyltransferase family protein n=1 Tax=Actinocrinis puniceicyclus TaxID=977794 RepID=A0A8J7WNA1_9ACTN|nr:ARMT1-like domain-containing protein [Actinocrinis puniceicyclus]MBS2965536.1 protein-glutamate O-methyltransferase family protein [Actinocrinis puniceicyclus]